MTDRRVHSLIAICMCAILSFNLIACGTNEAESSPISETTTQTDVSNTTVTSETSTLSATDTTNETTITEESETTESTIGLGDFGISLQEYEEQQEKAKQEAINAATEIGEVIVTTTRGTLNMRESPDIESKMLEQIPKGTIVPYYAIEGVWYLVQYNGKRGYIHSDFATIKGNDAEEYYYDYSLGQVQINTKTEPLNMRQSPDIESHILEKIPKGTIVAYYGVEGEWLLIEYNEKIGYIHSDYVKFVST